MSAPSSPRKKNTRDHQPAAPTPLRLLAFRGGLGIELYEAVELGPLRVEELTWSLPGVTFPLDLGGGVRAFRHRRGLLQRLRISVGLAELESWLTKRWETSSELGGLLRSVGVWPLSEGIGVGVFGERGVVAAELLWCPDADTAGFVIHRPRGVLEPLQPALSAVLMLVSRALGDIQTHEGRLVRLPAVTKHVLRALLPGLGFRLPDVGVLRCGSIEFRGDRMQVVFDRGLPPWAMPPLVARAREFAALALEGDRALMAGDGTGARRAYVAALEQAPRHPELSQTIASIDVHFEERAESALGLLVESLPAVEFGLVGAELLAKTGDTEGARLAISKLVSHERFPPLGAAYWVKLSEWLPNGVEKAEAIELALACSAGSVSARWARFRARVALADVNGAVADAEHLEAGARGSEAKHAALLQCAQELSNVGLVDAAAKLFERALRYAPGDARASLGVALGLMETGKHDRATVVLQRTLDADNVDEAVASEANLALARLLAEHAGDLPAAIARARRATGLTKAAVEARGYEALWRAKIGDLAGASLAFSRLSEVIASSPEVNAHRAGHWLLRAGRFTLEELGDPAAAERYLSLALRRMPKDPVIAEAYRVAASKVVRRPRLTEPQDAAEAHSPLQYSGSGSAGFENSDRLTPTGETSASPHSVAHSVDRAQDDPVAQPSRSPDTPAPDDIELEQRVDALKGQLLSTTQAPAAVIDELVSALGQLGRLEEAYALIRAQYDDSSGEAQERLRTALARILTQLIEWSKQRGQLDDAELYELTLDGLRSS